MTLKQFVEESDTKAGRAFDLTVQLLVLILLVSFSVETPRGGAGSPLGSCWTEPVLIGPGGNAASSSYAPRDLQQRMAQAVLIQEGARSRGHDPHRS